MSSCIDSDIENIAYDCWQGAAQRTMLLSFTILQLMVPLQAAGTFLLSLMLKTNFVVRQRKQDRRNNNEIIKKFNANNKKMTQEI